MAGDPHNADTLMLLAKVQLFSRHYAQAVSTAQRIHALPHAQYALVHYLAARALEAENRLQDAEAELQVFLREETKGPRADASRKEIGLLESGELAAALGNQ